MDVQTQHPFQCLAVAEPPGSDTAYLLAACGARLVSTSLGKDATVSEWTSTAQAEDSNAASTGDGGERPAKKQKTGPAASATSNIIKLTVSPSHRYAVVVTEDKIVRVLEIGSDGSLHDLSQRAMPKRPCAIDILPDNATILCGDKFGDVYSMPLLPDESTAATDTTLGAQSEETPQVMQPFKPSASNTTVHTKRNRKALEAQLKQKNLTPKSKEPLKFEHKLLLGHVSMLTDLVHATRKVGGKRRSYILTSDRDEHIRVSRGPPQSHIIEGYCLGHTEYINKICLVPGTDLLISGGGNSWVGVWDWPSFELKRKIEILDTLKGGLKELTARMNIPGIAVENVNISGIWTVPMTGSENKAESASESAVVVACEGLPAILVCPVAHLLEHAAAFQCIPVSKGPVLDVTSAGDVVIAAFDTRKSEGGHRLQSFRLRRGDQCRIEMLLTSDDADCETAIQALNGLSAPVANERSLDGLLYGVANMRKRDYHTDEPADGEAEEALGEPGGPVEATAGD